MPIEMPRGLPFTVDTWKISSTVKRHQFLTHAHMDHLQGMVSHASYPVYSTLITRNLLLQFFPQLDEAMFVCIEVGESLVVKDHDGDFTVMAFDANHCPGAVMFLFEGKFGNILHTGDCRLTPECLQNLPCKYVGKKGKPPKCQLDCIFLDCTFGKFRIDMPSRHAATRQVINCIWDHPDAPKVYLACDLLGQEDILVQVSQAFGEKIYIDPTKNPKCFKTLQLIAPEIISQDMTSRFHLLGFPKLYEIAEAKVNEARADLQSEPLIIRPSSQWYAWDEGVSDIIKQKKERIDQAVRDLVGVWHVCYSIHSSREELEWALELLSPKWVVSTTPGCRAMEFDYVKKYCFNDKQAVNDCISKLMGIREEDHLDSDELLDCSDVMTTVSDCFTEIESEPVILSRTNGRKRLSLSPPESRSAVTLFGRARNWIEEAPIETEDVPIENEVIENLEHSNTKEAGSADVKFSLTAIEARSDDTCAFGRARNGIEEAPIETEDVHLENEDVENSEHLNSKEAGYEDIRFSLTAIETVTDDTSVCSSVIRVSNRICYGENMRKIYRSLNVPIPQRLPSLVKLMSGLRCVKRKLY